MKATSDQDADACYEVALELVRAIDAHLQQRTRHYRDTQGRLLVTLDEVIHAILAGTLILVPHQTDFDKPDSAAMSVALVHHNLPDGDLEGENG